MEDLMNLLQKELAGAFAAVAAPIVESNLSPSPCLEQMFRSCAMARIRSATELPSNRTGSMCASATSAARMFAMSLS